MAAPPRPRTRHEFSIALICALRKESDAVLAIFDGHWRDNGGEFTKVEGDSNIYWTGWIGEHSVVLVQMPGMGNTNAAGVAGCVLASFPRIRLALVVGICGGVPGRTKQEMILGDVVISTRIIQLTLASRYPDALVMKNTYEDHLGRPNAEVMAFLEQIQGREFCRRLRSETAKWVQILSETDVEIYRYPGKEDDKLYEAGYRHKHQDPTICDICACCENYEDPVCEMARKKTCTELHCDESKLVTRGRLQDVTKTEDENVMPTGKRADPDTVAKVPDPMIHFGPVGSGDWVIKSQMHRDTVDHEVIAYEMEGSGVSLNLPTLVVKSVCDYADSHKNKDWQNYAAATAAACTKAVLRAWPRVDYNMSGGIEERNQREEGPHRREEELQKAAQRKWYLEALRFDQIGARFEAIKNAHADTCGWLLARPEYQRWLASENLPQKSFFWIKGKPGAGKSTAMKFLLADIKARAQENGSDATIVLQFFFSARGHDLEKSTEGLYRALLFQLLTQVPSLQRVLDALPPLDRKLGRPDFNGWAVERLQYLFEHTVRKVRSQSSLFCLIDALDECEEAQIREMVTFFENLSVDGGDYATRNCFRTCFSSRHYPHITVDDSTELILEEQDDHRHDIASFLSTGLKGQGKIVAEMKAKILERSSGIFLWVCLVVKILNTEYDHGRVHAMRKRLDKIPDGLDDLFCDILTRDTRRMDELFLTLRLLLFARRSFKPEEIYHAILVGTEPECVAPWDDGLFDKDAIQRFISSTSKGLAGVTKDGSVQFIHESVRHYFLKEQGLQRLWPDLIGNFQGLSHDMLARCCQNYVDICTSQCSYLATRRKFIPWEDVSAAAEKFPFLRYAIINGIFHADAAAGSGIEQSEQVKKFSFRTWVSFHEVSRNKSSRPEHAFKSSLHIFTIWNLGNLVQIECENDRNMGIQREDYNEPLAYAIQHKSEKAIRALLTPAGRLRPEHQLPYLSDERFEAVIKFLLSESNSVQNLVSAAKHGAVDVVAAMLRTKKVEVNRSDGKGRTALWWAAKKGIPATVQLFLETDRVDVNIGDADGVTPLQVAAAKGHVKVVQLLLETDRVDINIANADGYTPLQVAAAQAHVQVVQLLLETGRVNINTTDIYDYTPLMSATVKGHKEIVQLLLETGKVDVNITRNDGCTPLMTAAIRGHKEIVQLLLETGEVDVNIGDDNGCTPLIAAATEGIEELVHLLLESGKVDIWETDRQGGDALMRAIEYGHDGVVQLIQGWMRREFLGI